MTTFKVARAETDSAAMEQGALDRGLPQTREDDRRVEDREPPLSSHLSPPVPSFSAHRTPPPSITLSRPFLSMSLPFHPPSLFFFFFNDTATTEIYTLSLHGRSSDLKPLLLIQRVSF